MEIHEHRSLLLGGFYWEDSPRILRDILCLSMSAAEPLVIGPRHWPQTWRRACTDYLGSKRDYGETPWIEIDNFRELMGIDIHEYRAFRDVNKRIIIQPLAEINRISDFRVTVEYRHKGRKVTALKFKMRRVVALPEPATMQAPLFPELDDTPLIVKELRDAGLSMQDALDIWQQGFRCVHEG